MLSKKMSKSVSQHDAAKSLSAALDCFVAQASASFSSATNKATSKSDEEIIKESYSNGVAVTTDSAKDYAVWKEGVHLGASVPVSYTTLIPIIEAIPKYWASKRAQLALAMKEECKKLSSKGSLCDIDEEKLPYKLVYNYERIGRTMFPTPGQGDDKELTFWRAIVDSNQWLVLGDVVTESDTPPTMGTVVVKNSLPIVKPPTSVLRVVVDAWEVKNNDTASTDAQVATPGIVTDDDSEQKHSQKEMLSFFSMHAGEEYECPGHIVLTGAPLDVDDSFGKQRMKFGCVKKSMITLHSTSSSRYGNLATFPIIVDSSEDVLSNNFQFQHSSDAEHRFPALNGELMISSSQAVLGKEKYVDPLTDLSSSGPKFQSTSELKQWMAQELYADQLVLSDATLNDSVPTQALEAPAPAPAASWTPLVFVGAGSLLLILVALIATVAWVIWFRVKHKNKRKPKEAVDEKSEATVVPEPLVEPQA